MGRLGRKTGGPMRTSQPRKKADESQKIISLVKNLLTQMGSWRRKLMIWWKVVHEKPLDLGGILGGKPTPYDWGIKGWGSRARYETWKSKGRSFDEVVGWKSHAVTCNAAEDVKCRSYPNLSKNTIKFKCSSVFFSSFVSAISWPSSLLFKRLSGLDCRFDCWFSHRWCGVDSKRSCSQLVRMIFMERAVELSEMLNRWSWLPGILFLWISFPWDQIVETW